MDAWKSSSGWHQEAKSPQWAELKKTIKGYQTGFWIYVQERKFAKGLGTLVKVNGVVNTWQGKENDLYFYVAFWNFYTWIPPYSLHVSILQRPWEAGPAPTLKTLSSVHPPLELGLLPWSPPQDEGRKWSLWGEGTKAQDGRGHKRAAPSALQVFWLSQLIRSHTRNLPLNCAEDNYSLMDYGDLRALLKDRI